MRLFFATLVLTLCPVFLDAEARENFGNYHAIVIGNNNYENIGDLKSAAQDAKAVAHLLKTAYGFKVDLLIDAKRRDVIGALADVRARLKTNDNLVIYYAGHGVLDEYAEEGYWLPVDAQKDNPSDWISNSDITNMVRAIRARHVMVIADSCYSGTLVRAAPVRIKTAEARNVWVARMNAKRSRTALVSGGLEPVIDSGGGSNHSVFARAFMNTLQENTGILDGQRLFTAVGRPVALESDQTPQYSDIRRSGHDGGDFLFVRTSATSVSSPLPTYQTGDTRGISVDKKGTAPLPTASTAPKAPAANPAVELAFWSSIQNSKDVADFDAYLKKYPRGNFADLARNRVRKLKAAQTASVATAPKPANWMDQIAGRYEGYLLADGKSRVTTIFGRNSSGSIIGTYTYLYEGSVEKGELYNCEGNTGRELACAWSERLGVGKFKVRFSTSLREFAGAWGSVEAVQAHQYWNGRRK